MNVTTKRKLNKITNHKMDTAIAGRVCSRREPSLVPRLSLSLLLNFACANMCEKIEGGGEPGTEPRPPVAFLAVIIC